MRRLRSSLVLVAALFALRLWPAARLELVSDEAYYWVWSRHLAAGYFDHPPAIAWLIRAGTALLGDTEAGVRLGTGLLGALAVLLAAATSTRPLVTTALLVSMPLMAAGGLFATPDVPLLAAWALGLWAASRDRWALLGLAAGLAMLSKYTGLLLLPLVVASRPASLRSREPWLAGLLALAVYAPNLAWNLLHDGVSWRWQLDHAASAGRHLEFVGAQAGLLGPVTFLALLVWWVVRARAALSREPEQALQRLCWWTSLPVFVVGVAAGGEANWAAPAVLGAAVGLASDTGRFLRASHAGALTAATLSVLIYVHAARPIFRLPADPTDRLEGGLILADSVRAWGIDTVYCSRYQEAALIHFYSGIAAHVVPGDGRPSQYDLWTVPSAQRALYVRPWSGERALYVEGLGWERGSPNVVQAFRPTPDPLVDREVGRWQVYEVWPGGRADP